MKDSGALAIWRLRGYWGVSIRGTSCVVPQIISPAPVIHASHEMQLWRWTSRVGPRGRRRQVQRDERDYVDGHHGFSALRDVDPITAVAVLGWTAASPSNSNTQGRAF
jgi:hypothetical protein